MFYLEYNTAIDILRAMDRILDDIDAAVERFEQATNRYNATMQDAVAREATLIIKEQRQQIEAAKLLITKSKKIAQEGASGLKEIEDFVSDGGLN